MKSFISAGLLKDSQVQFKYFKQILTPAVPPWGFLSDPQLTIQVSGAPGWRFSFLRGAYSIQTALRLQPGRALYAYSFLICVRCSLFTWRDKHIASVIHFKNIVLFTGKASQRGTGIARYFTKNLAAFIASAFKKLKRLTVFYFYQSQKDLFFL